MRRIFLVSRMTLLAATGVVSPTLLACLDHPLKDVEYEAASEKENAVALTVNKDVDILFVIDNSGSMGEEQGLLAANFPAFIDVLEDPVVKANYRIGVTTTDNGNPQCGGSTSPEAGKLQLSSCRSRQGEFVSKSTPPADATAVACTDVCSTESIGIEPTTTEFDPEPKERPWLENIEGKTNLAGDISTTEAFQCFGPQGIAGCGFESHLESMYKALLRAQNADEKQYGFLRSNAILSVVIITDEVDCSYNNEYASIFLSASQGGGQVFWSDPDAMGPTSAVCWNAGVVCEGSGTPYDTCRSSNKDVDGDIDVADGDAVLHPLNRYIDFIQEIETAKQTITPSQEVLVALIAGVPDGYDGDLTYAKSLDPVEQNDFGIGAGCTYASAAGTSTARPPVREREFAEAFEVGDEPNIYSICQDDYSDALSAIANTIRDQIKPACMTACVADTDPVGDGLQPQCTLIQEAPDVASGDVVETNIETCAADGSLPDGEDVCFVTLVDDRLSDVCSEEGWNLEFQLVRRDGVPAPGGTAVSATCQLSQSRQIDCPGLP